MWLLEEGEGEKRYFSGEPWFAAVESWLLWLGEDIALRLEGIYIELCCTVVEAYGDEVLGEIFREERGKDLPRKREG